MHSSLTVLLDERQGSCMAVIKLYTAGKPPDSPPENFIIDA